MIVSRISKKKVSLPTRGDHMGLNTGKRANRKKLREDLIKGKADRVTEGEPAIGRVVLGRR